MSRINFRRGIAVLVLGVVLGAPLVASAAPRAAGWRAGIPTAGPAPLAWLWTFLARAWAKNGCSVDPNGRCLDGLQAPADNGCGVDPNGITAKNGCHVDPNGITAKNGCRIDPDGITAKNGCRIDPNGHCLDGLQAPADNGCGVDPDGRCAPGQ